MIWSDDHGEWFYSDANGSVQWEVPAKAAEIWQRWDEGKETSMCWESLTTGDIVYDWPLSPENGGSPWAVWQKHWSDSHNAYFYDDGSAVQWEAPQVPGTAIWEVCWDERTETW